MKLRPMHWSDLPAVRNWRNHPDVRRNMYTHHQITEEEHQEWWQDRLLNDNVYLIAEEDDPVGYVSFSNRRFDDRTADWAFYKAPDAPKGTGSNMERLALEYAFETLKLEKLSCEVLAYNKPVYYLHRKHGFQVEGIFRKAHLFEGERHDIYRMAIFKGDWKDALEQKLVGWDSRDTWIFDDEQIRAFSEVIADHNSLHKSGPEQIAPGMFTGSLFSGFIAGLWPGAVYLQQSLNFKQPVRPGQQVIIVLKCVSQIRRRVWFETIVKRGDEIVLEGEALILLPKP